MPLFIAVIIHFGHPSTTQIPLLINDNLYLKGEVKDLKRKHEAIEKARNELLKQVDDLQVSSIHTEHYIKTNKAQKQIE